MTKFAYKEMMDFLVKKGFLSKEDERYLFEGPPLAKIKLNEDVVEIETIVFKESKGFFGYQSHYEFFPLASLALITVEEGKLTVVGTRYFS